MPVTNWQQAICGGMLPVTKEVRITSGVCPRQAVIIKILLSAYALLALLISNTA